MAGIQWMQAKNQTNGNGVRYTSVQIKVRKKKEYEESKI